jgi:hypothetical protein
MRRFLIFAGLITAFLWSDIGGMAPRAMAQVVASPVNPNAVMLRQMRMRMRLRRHHHRRHHLPAGQMIILQNSAPGNPAGLNPTPVNANRASLRVRRAAF